MRTVLISQRVEIIKNYGERRDCLDQNWCGFLKACGFLPVPVMNREEDIKALADAVKPTGILLTGGNDLTAYGGDTPERDMTEQRLIELGMTQGIPVMGVCRGLQMIVHYFGGELERVQGHVASRHRISGEIIRDVNSYHNFAVLEVPNFFDILAKSDDGVIEAIRHREKKLMGIMWHPERERNYCTEDIELFMQFFA